MSRGTGCWTRILYLSSWKLCCKILYGESLMQNKVKKWLLFFVSSINSSFSWILDNFEEKWIFLSGLISVYQLIFENFDFKLSMENHEEGTSNKNKMGLRFFFQEVRKLSWKCVLRCSARSKTNQSMNKIEHLPLFMANNGLARPHTKFKVQLSNAGR